MHGESPIKRRESRKIWVGNVPVGGDAPIAVQSMTNTDTNDVMATVAQIQRLVDAGVDIQRVYGLVFETVPMRKLRLLGRVIDHLTLYERGRVAISHVERADFIGLGAAESDTEGLVDNLRAISGVEVAALIREPPLDSDGVTPPNRVSLRSRGAIDVSEIARKTGGGGHKQAAGFSHGGDLATIHRFIAAEAAARLPHVGSAA